MKKTITLGLAFVLTGCRPAHPAMTFPLPPAEIHRVVRDSFGPLRQCYERGLRENPSLHGRVLVNFLVGPDGTVRRVSDLGSEMPDGAVVSCVARVFCGLVFPSPTGGAVTVAYPLVFLTVSEGTVIPQCAARALECSAVPTRVPRPYELSTMSCSGPRAGLFSPEAP
jgi:hypothetical protein